jgi:hypothetical protein
MASKKRVQRNPDAAQSTVSSSNSSSPITATKTAQLEALGTVVHCTEGDDMQGWAVKIPRRWRGCEYILYCLQLGRFVAM